MKNLEISKLTYPHIKIKSDFWRLNQFSCKIINGFFLAKDNAHLKTFKDYPAPVLVISITLYEVFRNKAENHISYYLSHFFEFKNPISKEIIFKQKNKILKIKKFSITSEVRDVYEIRCNYGDFEFTEE